MQILGQTATRRKTKVQRPVIPTGREPRRAIRVRVLFFFMVFTSRLRLVTNNRTGREPRRAIRVRGLLFFIMCLNFRTKWGWRLLFRQKKGAESLLPAPYNLFRVVFRTTYAASAAVPAAGTVVLSFLFVADAGDDDSQKHGRNECGDEKSGPIHRQTPCLI